MLSIIENIKHDISGHITKINKYKLIKIYKNKKNTYRVFRCMSFVCLTAQSSFSFVTYLNIHKRCINYSFYYYSNR